MTDSNSPAGNPFFVYEEIRFRVLPLSPAETDTSLQIVCFFNNQINQVYGGGTQAVDNNLHGAIKKLRDEGHFKGNLFETLLLTPNGQIPAKRLLLFGLGEPDLFTIANFTDIGHAIIYEAAKLNVTDLCFAPSVKDAGFVKFAGAAISEALLLGMQKAITSLQKLHAMGLVPVSLLKEINLLAGKDHVQDALKGMEPAFKGK